jgi:hypothetical protein
VLSQVRGVQAAAESESDVFGEQPGDPSSLEAVFNVDKILVDRGHVDLAIPGEILSTGDAPPELGEVAPLFEENVDEAMCSLGVLPFLRG